MPILRQPSERRLAPVCGARLWILQPFLPALIWSTLVVVSKWPLMQAVQKRWWGKRSLAVAVMMTALLLVVIVPFALAVLTIVEHADDVGGRIETLAQVGVPAPPTASASLS